MGVMKRNGLIVFIVACFDIVLLALAIGHGFADKACFAARKLPAFETVHSENTTYNWYYKPRTDNLQPDEQPEFAFIKNYDAFWIGRSDDKVIYLTFDAGFEAGYTSNILDTLKKHDVSAAFFVVGHYITSSPELVNRMVSEGHLVCNHSTHHKDMASMADFESFKKEMKDIETVLCDATGTDMPKYYRPPEGRFSERSLKYAQQLGYKTFFWSFAYKDWIEGSQPAHSDAIQTILSRTHPGMVALLHATSKTNAQILDSVIIEWKSMGYRFESLDAFTLVAPQ